MPFRKRAFHQTAVVQKHAGVSAEELVDYKTGERVMTVDGFPGRVVAVVLGPYQGTETYQVTLDSGMGGGDYGVNQLSPYRDRTASIVEAVEVTSSIPFEAVTDHTANLDYPELEDILTERLPIENLRHTAAVNQDNEASVPDSTKDDSSQNIDQQQSNEGATADTSQDPPADPVDATTPTTGPQDLDNVEPPHACSFCGHDQFEDQQETGRGLRIRCSQCKGTMKSNGMQWEPEFPNSSQNKASETWDYRSGGPGGVVQAPGANYKVTMLMLDTMSPLDTLDSLHAEAGVMQWLYNRMYEKARQRYEDKHTTDQWWDSPDLLPTDPNVQGPAHYENLVTPHVVHTGSKSELDDPEWGWHFTSSWMDVQEKARRIRQSGGVKIVAAAKLFVNAEVQGDANVYETQLNYVPGTKKVADWACGCKWAAYAWGRSKNFSRFEGRLCSHALATQYEASAQGIFGREIAPDPRKWLDDGTPIVVQHERGAGDHSRPSWIKRSMSTATLDSDGIYPDTHLDLEHPPVYATIQTMVENDAPWSDIFSFVGSSGLDRPRGHSLICEAILDVEIAKGMPVHGMVPSDGSESISEPLRHTADYSTADPFAGMDGGAGAYNVKSPHSNSANPASTGWATSQDPGDWGKSLISNDFGVTFDAALHVTGAKDVEPPSVSGVALKAADTGRVWMQQRSIKDDKDPARGTWEFPGGHHEKGDQTSLHAGIREFEEESGHKFPEGGHVTHVHRSGPYLLHTVVIPSEDQIDMSSGRHTVNPDDPGGDDHEQGAWWHPADAEKNPALRSELKKNSPFDSIKKAAVTEDDPLTGDSGDPGMSDAAMDFESRLTDATLNDSPEAALPFTDGGSEEVDSSPLAGDTRDGEHGDDTFDTDNSLDKTSSSQRIIDEFHKSAGALALAADVGGFQKESMKDFNFMEQQELINEGKGGPRARNSADLKIAGTHYELIGDDDRTDETILWT